MGEDANEVTVRADLSGDAPAVTAGELSGMPSDPPAPVEPALHLGVRETDGSSGDDEVAAARGQIEEARAQIGETVDAIQERLSPSHVVHEATSAVRDATVGRAQATLSSATGTVGGLGSTVGSTIRDNPIPAALAVIGLGWLYIQSRQGSRPAVAQPMGQVRSTASGAVSRLQESTAQVTGQAQQAVDAVTDQVRGTLSQAADHVHGTAAQLQGQVTQLGGQTQYQAQRAQSTARQMLHEQPLAVAAAAVVFGMALGLAVPETAKEHELLGPARDSVLGQAQERVQDAAQRLQGVAQEAISAASTATKEGLNTA